MKVDVLCLQETQINLNQKPTFLSKKYDFLSMFHLHGISTHYKKNNVLETSKNYITCHVESIIVDFHIQEIHLRIVNVYIAPHASLQGILHFVNSILKATNQQHYILIIGDLNFDILKNSNTQKCSCLL